MAARGRTAGFKMPEEHRVKIANSNILKKLIEAAEGKFEMTSTQATIAIALMKKVLPDLSSVATGQDENLGPVKHSVTIEIVDK